MPTYGRHTGRGTATAYPVLCSLCGVVWPRSAMAKDSQGNFVCPDEGRGLDAKRLDQLNAKVRPRKDKKPADGLDDSDAIDTPLRILGDSMVAWLSNSPADMELVEGNRLHGWRNRADGTPLVRSGAGPLWSGNGVMSGGRGSGTMFSSFSLSAGARPYGWAAVRVVSLDAANRWFFGFGNPAIATNGVLVSSAGLYQARLRAGSGSETINGPAADTGLHLVEFGFSTTMLGRFVFDGTPIAGSSTSALAETATRLLVFGAAAATGIDGLLSEVVVSDSILSAAKLARMRAYFTSTYPDLELA